jgi:hypothetical protein
MMTRIIRIETQIAPVSVASVEKIGDFSNMSAFFLGK